MVNTNRIVPVEKIDLISLYALILLQNSNNSSLAVLQSSTIDGQYSCGTGVKIADQPVKTCNFTGASGTLYFVADYAYEGFSISGTAEDPADGSVDVVPDGVTLYKAVLSSGDITITKAGF